MFAAFNHLERTAGRPVTLEEFGTLVATSEAEREAPYAASVAARWVKATQEPRYRSQQLAIAKALGVDPGWLWFGDDCAAGMIHYDHAGSTLAAMPSSTQRVAAKLGLKVAEGSDPREALAAKKGKAKAAKKRPA